MIRQKIELLLSATSLRPILRSPVLISIGIRLMKLGIYSLLVHNSAATYKKRK